MELFRGSDIDQRVMERAGCLDYTHSPWESEKPDVYQRQIYYKFDKRVSCYRGEATCTQQKSRLSGRNGWLIEEAMTLHGVPLGDYFTVWALLSNLLSNMYFIFWNLLLCSFSRLPAPLINMLFLSAASLKIPGGRFAIKICRLQCASKLQNCMVKIHEASKKDNKEHHIESAEAPATHVQLFGKRICFKDIGFPCDLIHFLL